MSEDEHQSPLEQVRRRLYARGASKSTANSGGAPAEQIEGWQGAPQDSKSKLPIAALFLIIAVGFFVVAGIAAALILLLGGRSVSSDRIEIRVEGPTTVAGGEDVSLHFVIENENPAAATNVVLSVDFPEGAYEAGGGAALSHYVTSLEDIPAGDSARHSVRTAFFGGEGDTVRVPIKVEYRTTNSNATFVKESTYELVITTAPVSIAVETRTEVASGQPFTMNATVRSNAPGDLENVAVRVTYPSGFLASKTEPAAVGTGVFPLGTLRPGEEAKISITGALTGQDGDERVFKFYVGALTAPGAVALAKPEYTVRNVDLRISKPFLSVNLAINQNETEPFVIAGGEDVQAIVSWLNALTSSIEDAKIEIQFGGTAFDPESVSVANGVYRSRDQVVVFDRTTEPSLSSVRPDESGVGAFSFGAKSGEALALLRSPTVTLAVSVSGRRTAGSGSETLNSTLSRTVKVATDLALTSTALYTTGPFANTGPFPPEADRETTYTISWKAANSVNTIAGASVSVSLPSNVRFTGKIEPFGSIVYNDITREVTWEIGDMVPGTTREAAFQIAITPDTGDIGNVPVLIPAHSIRGFDRFVQQEVTFEAERLTTELFDDPGYTSSDGRVQ